MDGVYNIPKAKPPVLSYYSNLEGDVFPGFILFTIRKRSNVRGRGLPPGGGRGGLHPEGPDTLPRSESEKRAVRIILECFLVWLHNFLMFLGVLSFLNVFPRVGTLSSPSGELVQF